MNNPTEQLSQLLYNITYALDMPEHLSEQVEKRYREIGTWLADDDSPLAGNSPQIYPQGSWPLGTVVRPITEQDEFDIDTVARIEILKQSISQKELMDRVGDRLRAHTECRKVLTRKRRCWRLDFSEGFHMDVLPAIPDVDWPGDSILITDRDLTHWQHSNPKGYATWFRNRVAIQFDRERRALAEALQAEIEAIPVWKIKTPLQRAIQLLKRHRDLYFRLDQDDKPISIIVTTLAAWAYQGQEDILETVTALVHGMPDHIVQENGIYWVANPVHPAENFADKWAEYPQRRVKFYGWLEQLKVDLKLVREVRGLPGVTRALGVHFGESVAQAATTRLGQESARRREVGRLRMASGTGMIGTAGATLVRNHTFYGDVA